MRPFIEVSRTFWHAHHPRHFPRFFTLITGFDLCNYFHIYRPQWASASCRDDDWANDDRRWKSSPIVPRLFSQPKSLQNISQFIIFYNFLCFASHIPHVSSDSHQILARDSRRKIIAMKNTKTNKNEVFSSSLRLSWKINVSRKIYADGVPNELDFRLERFECPKGFSRSDRMTIDRCITLIWRNDFRIKF